MDNSEQSKEDKRKMGRRRACRGAGRKSYQYRIKKMTVQKCREGEKGNI